MQKRLPWKIIDLWRVLGAISIFFFFVMIFIGFAIDGDPTEEGNAALTFVTFLIQELVFVLPVYLLVVRKYKTKALDFGFVNIGWKKTITWILKGFGLFLIYALVIGLFLQYSGTNIPGFAEQEAHLPWFGDGSFGLVVAIVTLVIIAPVVEEFLFRGFLLQTLLHKYPAWIASALTAAIFALSHFEFASIGIIFILALILNWIFIKSRSTWPGLIFHMANNGFALLVEFFLR